jgi:hypothetical protein
LSAEIEVRGSNRPRLQLKVSPDFVSEDMIRIFGHAEAIVYVEEYVLPIFGAIGFDSGSHPNVGIGKARCKT